MIWVIARREFLEYLKSMKFMIGFLITLALVTISTVINIGDFKQRQQDYISAREEMKGDAFNVRVYRPPQVLSVLVQGMDRKLGSELEMNYLRIPAKTSGYMGEGASQQYRYAAGFASIDYAFVVRIVLSLMVIFLIYDAVSGEKSLGTLRLVFANSIPRHAVLLGKVLGGATIIVLTLLVVTIVSLLLLLLNPLIVLTESDWIRILAIFGGSALYLLTFFTLGLFVSVVVNRPSIALAVLLQVWIFLGIIYPNVAGVIAESWYRLPTQNEIALQKAAATQSIEAEVKSTREEFNRQVMSGQEVSTDLRLKQADLSSKKAEKEYLVDLEVGKQLTRQSELVQSIALLSPMALYDQMMQRAARTGIEEFERFMDAVYRHWQQYVELTKLDIQHPEDRAKTKLPPFSVPFEPLSQSLVAVGKPVMLLILFGIFFFALAHAGFLRKDIR